MAKKTKVRAETKLEMIAEAYRRRCEEEKNSPIGELKSFATSSPKSLDILKFYHDVQELWERYAACQLAPLTNSLDTLHISIKFPDGREAMEVEHGSELAWALDAVQTEATSLMTYFLNRLPRGERLAIVKK